MEAPFYIDPTFGNPERRMSLGWSPLLSAPSMFEEADLDSYYDENDGVILPASCHQSAVSPSAPTKRRARADSQPYLPPTNQQLCPHLEHKHSEHEGDSLPSKSRQCSERTPLLVAAAALASACKTSVTIHRIKKAQSMNFHSPVPHKSNIDRRAGAHTPEHKPRRRSRILTRRRSMLVSRTRPRSGRIRSCITHSNAWCSSVAKQLQSLHQLTHGVVFNRGVRIKCWRLLGISKLRSHKPKPKPLSCIQRQTTQSTSFSKLIRLEDDSEAEFSCVRSVSESHEDVGAHDYMNDDLDARLFEGVSKRTEVKHEVNLLHSLLRHPLFFDHFFRFCALRHAEESLLFWHAVERYKEDFDAFLEAKNPNHRLFLAEIVKRDAFIVFDTFVDFDADYPVNLSSDVVRTAQRDIEWMREGDISTVEIDGRSIFDTAQREIVRLLKLDPFVGFRTSPLWSTLLRDVEAYLGLRSHSLD